MVWDSAGSSTVISPGTSSSPRVYDADGIVTPGLGLGLEKTVDPVFTAAQPPANENMNGVDVDVNVDMNSKAETKR